MRVFIASLRDRPGVLTRVTSLFRRRGWNIVSLTVARTETDGVSRMTLVVDADEDAARRLEANLLKLFDVLAVEEVAQPVARELAIVKVAASTEALHVADRFGARVVDVGATLTLELTGPPEKIDALAAALHPLGVVELVRTGVVATTRAKSRQEEAA